MKLAAILILVFSNSALAKARYAPKPEMIEKSCAIAIIEVKDVKKAKTQGEHWAYFELANAQVEKVIKGTLPASIELLGDEDFICERCQVKPGKYLAFLRPEGSKWACTNWYLSVRPIEGTQVKWYDSDGGTTLSSYPLNLVLKDIEKQMSKAHPSKGLEDPCRQQKADASKKSLLDAFKK